MTEAILPTLQTVRDWLRYAVSRFNEARLVYGHGTETAVDEAAFLVLSTLHLAPDTLEPWLDAKLTMAERKAVADVIEARVVTRKPASYLVKCAWIGPHRFYCDERTIVPRSFIGELLRAGLGDVLGEHSEPQRVLDLCTGSGCLAILAALEYPDAIVDAADASTDALAVAARNVADFGLGDRVALLEGDLFGAVDGTRYDLILSNPPYVTEAAVAAFPPEYRAEPVMAHDGGPDGLKLVKRILADAAAHLAPGGTLIMEIGQGRELLEAAYPNLPFLWLDTDGSEGEVFALSAAALGGAKASKAKAKARK